MSKIASAAVLALTAITLTACGEPGKSDVQTAMNRYAARNPLLFGSDKPVVKDAKCTKTGNDTYDCVTALATTNDPEAHTITIKLTKLEGKWEASIGGLFGL